MKIKWIVGGLLLTAGIVMLFVLDIVTGDVSVNDIWSDCDIKFQNGGRIATTVDCINTKIVSTSEPQGMDVWQHPKLTLEIRSGDCEDVVLLFAYINRNVSLPAVYCWGDCKNPQGDAFAHTWIELTSRSGEIYVLEFFGKTLRDCMVLLRDDKWQRNRRVMLSHDAFCEMAKEGFARQSHVFNKLSGVFSADN